MRRVSLMVFAALVLAGEPRKKLLGCWRRVDAGKSGLVRIEGGRVTLFVRGRLSVYRARHEKDRFELRAKLRRFFVGFELSGGALLLRFPHETWRLERIEGVPKELDLSPLPLGTAKRLPSGELKEIRKELDRRGALDQEVRKPFTAGGRPDPAAMRRMREVDADNTAYLVGLVGEWGWIDAKRFGARAARAAFLIVQHSGHLPLMQAALPEIERDVRARRGDAQEFALLHDRLQVRLGELQRYGTQVGRDQAGDPVVLPLEDPKRVDALRKKIGLMPLAQYLKMLQAAYGGKTPRLPNDDD